MLFVVPGPEAPVSGGNRYNEGLLGGLAAPRVDLSGLAAYPLASLTGTIWVDSLYMACLPDLRARAPRAQLALIAHSLPSTLAEASGAPDPAWIDRERAWLALLNRALAPSETMRAWLHARAPSLTVSVIAPAVFALPPDKPAAGPLDVLMVANLLPNKGVLPWLRALAAHVRPSDAFTLRIVGRDDLDPDYASRCRAVLAQAPALAAKTALVGELPHARLLEALARAHVLVSASRVESYGMAIAEARAAGCIVLAHQGGHVGSWLAPAQDDAQLASQLLSLVRDRGGWRERLARALVTRPPTRSWADVVREFAAPQREEPAPSLVS